MSEGSDPGSKESAELAKRRLELDRYKIDKEAALEARRLQLDVARATQTVELENRRLDLEAKKTTPDGVSVRNPALLTAAVALASVLVSGAQVLTTTWTRQRELELQAKEVELKSTEARATIANNDRRLCVDTGKFAIEKLQGSGANDGTKGFVYQYLVQTCPGLATTLSSSPETWDAGVAADAGPLPSVDGRVIEANGANPLTVPAGGWASFSVLVLDARHQPVHGAKVGWRTIDLDTTFTYVGVTDEHGVSAATNMYTRSDATKHEQAAQLLEGDPPVGFTNWDRVKPVGRPVTFAFTFGAPK
jgi:hypothetical protein